MFPEADRESAPHIAELPSFLSVFSLEGRVAVVTGASSGLGAGFAKALVGAGADVVLAARRMDLLDDVRVAIEAHGRRVLAVQVDVTDPEQCARVAFDTTAAFGRLDILVNNAGIGTAVPATREIPDDFRSVYEVNVFGTYWMSQAAARVMQPGSSIINIASVLGLIKSYAPQAAYASSKAAVLGLTRDLSQQWAGRKGIRVNAVAPGYFESELTASVPPGPLKAFIDQSTPLKRMGLQRELDAAIVFLASAASNYITGSTLAVDGGMSGH
ncbi:SDR family NAD(P)-dependent oxidoreductase [Nocardia vinacea]|uniref:SDR family NAD(P)-dependent oxidoreductase n=1 Tax=Nocardia vinacea TaxID=96468 RepID=UPI001C3F45AA|nr:SDR family oxidoreductase [Nocardia vinacea]